MAFEILHFVRNCVFWQLAIFILFYDPPISRPQVFEQDFVVNFATYTGVYAVL